MTNGNNGIVSVGSSPYFGLVTSGYQVMTEAGSMLSFRGTVGKPNISPRLYFRFVKSKLTPVEQDTVRERVAKLQKIVRDTESMGQTGLYEKSMQALVTAIRELEAVAIGCGRFVTKEVIDRYFLVRREDGVSPVYFTPWHQFPRTVPPEVQKRILEVQEKKVFDAYWVLYLDYTKDGKPLKTNKEKIREKDPILFGVFNHAPDRYYHVVDWIDEACDLTFEVFLDQLKMKPDDVKVPDMTPAYFAAIKKEVEGRQKRLAETRPDNFRQLMAAEDAHKQKKPWWKFWGRS